MFKRTGRIERRIVAFGRIVLVAFAAGVVLTLLLSEAKPRPIELRITKVESLKNDEAIRVFGTMTGVWGFFLRGWGQLATDGGMDLIAGDGRGYEPKGRIEELFCQNYLWPPNWFRRDLWFSETIAMPAGFVQMRVFVVNREGKKIYSPAVPIGSILRFTELPPKDIAILAWPGKLTLPFQERPDSGSVRLSPP